MRLIDLTGKKFGRLTVLEKTAPHIQPNGQQKTMWKCKCDCGKECVIQAGRLRSKHTKSCGCLQKDEPNGKTHGKSNTKLHWAWKHIKGRCYKSSDPAYKNYGGRGITMDLRWKDNFQAFYDDVSKLPHFNEKGYTLDRIDNNGNYEINNVRWATKKEQNNNKRNNRLIEYNGETHTLVQWAKLLGVNKKTLGTRINQLHWDIQKAFETP